MSGNLILDLVDRSLSVLFWVPARILGVEKCSRCTIRVRWFQFLMAATWPVARVPLFRRRRVEWDLRADPQPLGGLRPVTLTEIGQP